MPRLDGRECETEGARWAWEPAGRHASTRRGASLRTLRGSTASAVDATPPTQLLPKTARLPHGPGGHEERRSSLASSVTDTGTRSDGAMPTLWSSMHWAGSWLHTRGGAGGVCSHGAVRWQQRGVRCSGRAAVQCRESEGVCMPPPPTYATHATVGLRAKPQAALLASLNRPTAASYGYSTCQHAG
jgi:hypothetical protein